MRFCCPNLRNLIGLGYRRDSENSQAWELETWSSDQSVGPIPKEEDHAAPCGTLTIPDTPIEAEDPAPKQTTPTKNQNEDQAGGLPRPNEDFPEVRPENSKRRSGRSQSHEFRHESFHPFQNSFQKENEPPSDEKINRLVSTIEMGHKIRYQSNEGAGGYDFLEVRPENSKRNSGRSQSHELDRESFRPLQGSSQKENELPSDEKINRLVSAIEMGHKIRYQSNEGAGGYDFLEVRPENSKRHSSRSQSHELGRESFRPLQGSSQKENESPSDEKINRLVSAIEMGHKIRYQSNEGAGGYDFLEVRPENSKRHSSRSQSHELGRESFRLLQGSFQKENEPPSDEKINRLVSAIEMGHKIRYQSNEGTGGYDIFARPASVGGGGADNEVEQRLPAAPGNSGQHMHGHDPIHGILNSMLREPSQLGGVRFSDQGAFSLSDQESVCSSSQESCDDLVALAERRFEVDQEWSSDEDEPCPPRNQPPQGSMGANRVRRLDAMGQEKFYTIFPIPFDVQKVPLLQTPSVYSDGTESEHYSPSFPISCKAAVKEAYRKFVLTSTEGPVIRKTSLSEGLPKDVELWLDHTKTSPPGMNQGKAEAFDIWEESEHGGPSPSGGQEVTARDFATWEDSEDGRPSPSGGQEGTARDFEIWEDSEYGGPFPSGSKAGTSNTFEIWEDSEHGGPSPSGRQARTANAFEIWEDIELGDPSPHVEHEGTVGAFGVWKDVEHGCPSIRKPSTALPCGALKNVTNILHPQYRMMVESVRTSAVAWDMKNKIDTKRVASLKGARKLPGSNPSRLDDAAELPQTGQVQDRINAIHFASAHSAVQDHITDNPPCPPNSAASLAASSNSNSLRDVDRTLVPHHGLALVGLESEDGDRTAVPHHRLPLIELESEDGDRTPVPHHRLPLIELESEDGDRTPVPHHRLPLIGLESEDGDRTPVPRHRLPLVELELHSPNAPSLAIVAINRATAAPGQHLQGYDSERAESLAFAQARFEGFVSPNSSPPIHGFVHSTGMYDTDMEVEGCRPYFSQPTPLRWLNPEALLERFHVAAETYL